MSSREYHHILVFSFSFIGDAILSTCVIAPLRRRYPQAQVSYLVGPAVRPLLEDDPQIDRVLVYDRRGKHRGLRGRWRLIQELRRLRFDLVVDLRDSVGARLIGATRWGITYRAHEAHAVVRYLSALRGIETDGAAPRIRPKSEELHRVASWLGSPPKGPRFVIHPGGNWPYKRWPPASFAALADRLQAAWDAQIVLLGGPGETAIVRAVAERMKISPLIFNEVSLREAAALIALCDHYIGNDTGPMHLAAAVGTPVTALFGPTDFRRSGPYGEAHRVVLSDLDLGCQPCHPGRRPGRCGRGSCAVLEAISVERVFQTIRAQRTGDWEKGL